MNFNEVYSEWNELVKSLGDLSKSGRVVSSESSGKVDVQKHLRPIRKALGTEKYKEYLKANGITWEENTKSVFADTMRASMAAKKWIEQGNKLDEELYDKMLKGEISKDVKDVDSEKES